MQELNKEEQKDELINNPEERGDDDTLIRLSLCGHDFKKR